MKTQRLTIAVVLIAATPCAWMAADDDRAAPVAPRSTAAEEIPPPVDAGRIADAGRFRYVGSASCTAANCHGGDGSRPVRPAGDPLSPQAYSLWIESDPHAGAYALLFDEPSQKIAQRLGLPNAHTAKECLDCHAIEANKSELTTTARHTPHDGVGCEACHGAAEAWLDPHKWDAWAALSAAQKSELGYRDLTDLVRRAETCAACHVGSAGRDVDHDLIAAGHPRMAFELSAYHANLPKHWKNEKTPPDEFDARLWLVGQAASASSSLALLAHRAGDASAPWPEFSEYDCFACHHDLSDPSWRQEEFTPSAALKPGAARWGSWHFSSPLFADASESSAGGGNLDKLRVEMQRLAPRRDVVQALAQQVRREVAVFVTWAATKPLKADDRRKLMRQLTDAERISPAVSWDAAAQRFLGCAAVNFSAQLAVDEAGGERPHEVELVDDALRRIRALLQFSDDGDSPQYDSPKNQSADRRRDVRKAFEEIHKVVTPDAPSE